MSEDFIVYGTLGGKYAAPLSNIISYFSEYLKHKNDENLRDRFLFNIEQEIDLFRQWAYRQADGDTSLLTKIDDYVEKLYDWVKEGKKNGYLDEIEHSRLTIKRQSLIEMLGEHIPARLIQGGQDSINELLNRIETECYIERFPHENCTKCLNEEIKRLSLPLEKIDLLVRLVKKIHPENANKYDYLHYLDEISGDIRHYLGVLERSRNELYASIGEAKRDTEKHLPEIEKTIDETSGDIRRHFSELKERIAAKKASDQKDSGKAENKKSTANDKKTHSKKALALATLKDHPDWTDEQIAQEVGVSRTTLYDWQDFKKAKEILKQGKNDIPRGSKNGKTGDIEAWDDKTQPTL